MDDDVVTWIRLGTNAFLWLAARPDRIPKTAREVPQTSATTCTSPRYRPRRAMSPPARRPSSGQGLGTEYQQNVRTLRYTSGFPNNDHRTC